MRLELATQNDIDAIIVFYDDVTARTPDTASNTSTPRTQDGRTSISSNINKLSSMNILILAGSPRKGGNTDLLVEAFVEGSSQKHNMAKAGSTVHVLSDCITSYDTKKLTEMLAYYESKGCEVKTLAEYQ